MTVDERGLEAAARAIDPKAWHDWDNRNFPRDLPRHLDNRGHRLTPSLDSARAAIAAYLSARSAEPVAVDCGHCGGSGILHIDPDDEINCAACGGTGDEH